MCRKFITYRVKNIWHNFVMQKGLKQCRHSFSISLENYTWLSHPAKTAPKLISTDTTNSYYGYKKKMYGYNRIIRDGITNSAVWLFCRAWLRYSVLYDLVESFQSLYSLAPSHFFMRSKNNLFWTMLNTSHAHFTTHRWYSTSTRIRTAKPTAQNRPLELFWKTNWSTNAAWIYSLGTTFRPAPNNALTTFKHDLKIVLPSMQDNKYSLEFSIILRNSSSPSKLERKRGTAYCLH